MLRRDEAGWSNPKVLSIFGMIFLCGLAFGSVVTRAYLHSHTAVYAQVRPIEAAQRFGLTRLRTALDLTPAQEKTITEVLDDYGKYYQNIEDQREDVAEQGKQRILDTLDEKQKKRFNQIFLGRNK
jgi:hypothetical protein